jgi:hypothetical protein
MINSRKLKERLNNAETSIKANIGNMRVIAKDAERVSKVAKDVHIILENIDKQFAKATKLTGVDITFLFFCAALQVARQILLPNDAFRLTANQGDELIKGPLKKIVKDKKWQDILLGSVPYDAVTVTANFKDLEINTGISGTTHRYRTLGHDPVLGWIFGPVNILSDSLTKNNFIDTYLVENMKIAGIYPGSTIGAVKNTIVKVNEGFRGNDLEKKLILPAAIIKQAIHFGADYFTKQGLPVPLIASFGSVGDNISKELLTKLKINSYSIMRSAVAAILINSIIEFVHKLFYNEQTDGSLTLYEVRTRKILSYSNLLASSVNIIQVAVRSAVGDAKAIKELDIGGFIVTLYRIATDTAFITKAKQEFLEKEFYNIVMGDDYNF